MIRKPRKLVSNTVKKKKKKELLNIVPLTTFLCPSDLNIQCGMQMKLTVSVLFSTRCMWLVSGYCRLLQRLTYLSDSHPLTAEVMWALGGGCPSITSLVIPPLFPWLADLFVCLLYLSCWFCFCGSTHCNFV